MILPWYVVPLTAFGIVIAMTLLLAVGGWIKKRWTI